MILVFRPIQRWPGEFCRSRRDSPFSADYRSTLALLERELEMLCARHPVLQLAITDADLRIDGTLKANARPSHPGVVLSFDTKAHGALTYATDVFWTWQANLRGIALGLEALRKVERYGIAQRGEQYTGWKALPPGTPMPGRKMTVDEAARFIARHADGAAGATDGEAAAVAAELVATPALLDLAYRQAARRLHPDVGGDEALFVRLQEAKRVLDEHGGPR